MAFHFKIFLLILAVIGLVSTSASEGEAQNSDHNKLAVDGEAVRATSVNVSEISINVPEMKETETSVPDVAVHVLMRRRKTNPRLPFRRKDLRSQRMRARLRVLENEGNNTNSTANSQGSNDVEENASSQFVKNEPLFEAENFDHKSHDVTVIELEPADEPKKSYRQRKEYKSIRSRLKGLGAKRLKKNNTSGLKADDFNRSSMINATENRSNNSTASLVDEATHTSVESRTFITNKMEEEHVPEQVKPSPGGPTPPKQSPSLRKMIRRPKKPSHVQDDDLQSASSLEVKSMLPDESSYPLYKTPLTKQKISGMKSKKILRRRKIKSQQSEFTKKNSEGSASKGKSHFSGRNSAAVSFQHTYVPGSYRPYRHQHRFPFQYRLPIEPHQTSFSPSSYSSQYNPLQNTYDVRPPPPPPPPSLSGYGPPKVRPFYPSPMPGSFPSQPPIMVPVPGRGQFGTPPLGTEPPTFAKPMATRPNMVAPDDSIAGNYYEVQKLRSPPLEASPVIIDSVPTSNFVQSYLNLEFPLNGKPPMLTPNFLSHQNNLISQQSMIDGKPFQTRHNTIPGHFRNTLGPPTPPSRPSTPVISPSGPVAIAQQSHSFPGLEAPHRTPKVPSFRGGTPRPFNPDSPHVTSVGLSPSTHFADTSLISTNGFPAPNFRGISESSFGLKETSLNGINTISENINNFQSGNDENVIRPETNSNSWSNAWNNNQFISHEDSGPSYQVQPPPNVSGTFRSENTTSIPVRFSRTKFHNPTETHTTTTTTSAPLPKDNIDLSQHGRNSLPVINTFHRLKLDVLAPPFPSVGPERPNQDSGRQFNENHASNIFHFDTSTQGASSESVTTSTTTTLPPIIELKDLLFTTPLRASHRLKEHSLKPFNKPSGEVTDASWTLETAEAITTTATPTLFHSVRSSSDWLSSLKTKTSTKITPTPLISSSETQQEANPWKSQSLATTFLPHNQHHSSGPLHSFAIDGHEQFKDLISAKKSNNNLLDSLGLLSPLASKPLPPQLPRNFGTFRNLINSNEDLNKDSKKQEFLHQSHKTANELLNSHHDGRLNFWQVEPGHEVHKEFGTLRDSRPANEPIYEREQLTGLQDMQIKEQSLLLSSPAPSASFHNARFKVDGLGRVPDTPHLAQQASAITSPRPRAVLGTQNGQSFSDLSGNKLDNGFLAEGGIHSHEKLTPISEFTLNSFDSSKERQNSVHTVQKTRSFPRITINSLDNTETGKGTNKISQFRSTLPSEITSSSLANVEEGAVIQDAGDIILLTGQNAAAVKIPNSLLEVIDFSRFKGRSFIFVRSNGHEYSVVFPTTEDQEQQLELPQLSVHDHQLQGLASEENNFPLPAPPISPNALIVSVANSANTPTIVRHLQTPVLRKSFDG